LFLVPLSAIAVRIGKFLLAFPSDVMAFPEHLLIELCDNPTLIWLCTGKYSDILNSPLLTEACESTSPDHKVPDVKENVSEVPELGPSIRIAAVAATTSLANRFSSIVNCADYQQALILSSNSVTDISRKRPKIVTGSDTTVSMHTFLGPRSLVDHQLQRIAVFAEQNGFPASDDSLGVQISKIGFFNW